MPTLASLSAQGLGEPGNGLWPADPAALTQWSGQPGPFPALISLLSLSLFSLTKDHRKRPKYNKLLVSTQDPSQPPSENPCPTGCLPHFQILMLKS